MKFRVEATQIMLFARSVGDENPQFVDLDHPEQMRAPPTFTESLQHFIPDYEYRPHPTRRWAGSGSPGDHREEATANTLHAEQHFEYYQAVLPGDVLTAVSRPGKTWQKAGRSGAMHFFERITEFRNQQDEIAVVSTLVGVTILPPNGCSDA